METDLTKDEWLMIMDAIENYLDGREICDQKFEVAIQKVRDKAYGNQTR